MLVTATGMTWLVEQQNETSQEKKGRGDQTKKTFPIAGECDK